MKHFLQALLCVLLAVPLCAQEELQRCFAKQVQPLKKRCLEISYHETLNELYHSYEPWQLQRYTCKGLSWIGDQHFGKSDTLSSAKGSYYSTTWFDASLLLWRDYGDDSLHPLRSADVEERLLRTLRYSPLQVVAAFYRKGVKPLKQSGSCLVYASALHHAQLYLYVERGSQLVTKVMSVADDALHGDVTTTWFYGDYTEQSGLYFPTRIRIEKMNGRVSDSVRVRAAKSGAPLPRLLKKPKRYLIASDSAAPAVVQVQKISDHLYGVHLLHTGTRSLIVEFNDFLLVNGAPLNTDNAYLVLNEARRLAPSKPVRYFTAGHHHPHYLGGVRAFVHRGATVLSAEATAPYLEYLIAAAHRLRPDSLELQARPLHAQYITDSLCITDGNYSVVIYLLGGRSGHTHDFLVYYFPQEKMLCEDDLVWIPADGSRKKASEKQRGLYQFILEKQLAVDTVLQTWGIGWGTYKTDIPFADLERSVRNP